MPLSSPIPNGAGAHAPAFLLRSGKRFFLRATLIAPLAVAAWLIGTGIGERLARTGWQRVTRDLPQLEMLSHQIAATLQEQGVCVDAPRQETSAVTDTPSRLEQLQARLAVQGSCLDLAIAQQQFETLQIETATIHIIQQKQLLTNGLVTDSVAYRAHSRPHHPYRKTPR